MFKNNKSILWGFQLLFFLCLIYMNYAFPFTSDDFTLRYHFDAETLREMLLTSYQFGNGRFLGNLSGMILVRHPLIRILFKSVCMFALYWSFAKLLDLRAVWLHALAAIFAVYPAAGLFAQVYVWTAGFMNYLPPVVLMLLSLLLLKSLDSEMKNAMPKIVLLAFFGIAMQLFAEHTTVFFLILALSISVREWYLKKHVKPCQIVFLAAVVSGALLMFLIPILSGSAFKMDGYRGGGGSLFEIARRAVENGLKFTQMMAACFLIWTGISLCALRQISHTEELRWKKYNIKGFLLFLFVMFPCYGLFYSLCLKSIASPWASKWNVLLGILFFLYLLCVAFVCKTWKLVAAGLVSLLPLLLVYPVRGRCFYLQYVIFALMALKIACGLDRKESMTPSLRHTLDAATLSCAAALLSVLVLLSADWRYANSLRYQYLNRLLSEGKTEITLPVLPHSELLQADGDSNFWQYYIEQQTDASISLSWTDWQSWLFHKEPPAQ
ncbi:MAG: hypothetical protein HFI46_00325 [Lachnospiraceae bacterium]|nr:hypothetical protein [Lachnospiraceae bacterium]